MRNDYPPANLKQGAWMSPWWGSNLDCPAIGYRQLAFEITPVLTSSSFLKILSITFSLPLKS